MLDFKKNEEEVLKFWEKNEIYEKSKKKNAKGKKFYMMDGPPYANASIHLGTALNKTLKDICMRAKRMQGRDVFDRPGYDTHGVPIELKIEKEIGSKSKQDIEKFGIDKFVKRCKEFATQHIDVMNAQFKNLGVWMDWDTPYITLSDEYMEAIWSAFKEADKKGLLYLGKYPVHVCSRCETAVAFNEIEYGKQKDTSIFVKFPLKKKKNTFLIIWTTTPWTLPANTGVMVHPEVEYQEIETAEGERWIIAKELVSKLMVIIGRGFTAKDEYKGKAMENWEYENPLAKYLKLKVKNGYKVILSARYVTTGDGSGLVHCAPGHGKEDYEVGKEYGIDMPSPVANNGLLTDETGKYAGKKAREVDREIIEDLEKENALIYKLEYEHDYPLCWRDKTPLLMISQPQWFFKISKIKEQLIQENEKNNWVPDWMKLRMKAWLEGISDWPVSRQRYWGTPLPIWRDEKSGEKIVVGSIKELEKLSGRKVNEMHKPGIDKIEITKSGKTLKRVPEVLDVWFDSGVSSWAALGYPGDDKKLKRYWPADLNIEGKDQIRGWWNSQMILSQILFGKKPFDNIVVHGMILDLGKKKLSKSEGKAVTPEEVINKYGRDYVRYYFAKLSKGEDFLYNEEEFSEIKKFFTILLNVNNFVGQLPDKRTKLQIEDRWIISKYNRLLKEVYEKYDAYKLPEVVQKLEEFAINDLSRGYIQIIRERAEETGNVLREINLGLLKLCAPIVPFMTETIWQELRQKKIVEEKSVHLSEWLKADEKKIDKKLEEKFETILKIIEQGMAERDKVKIGLRWPLACAIIQTNEKFSEEEKEIIARQLNVKKICIVKAEEIKVELDIKMTPELEAEGFSRELARKVQAERKNAGLKKGQLINLKINCEKGLQEKFNANIEFLKERTNAKKIEFADEKLPEKGYLFKIKEKIISLSFL
ncbi:MAG: isoleucine--tRNA ligase [Nanoarchaeota archaeon]